MFILVYNVEQIVVGCSAVCTNASGAGASQHARSTVAITAVTTATTSRFLDGTTQGDTTSCGELLEELSLLIGEPG